MNLFDKHFRACGPLYLHQWGVDFMHLDGTPLPGGDTYELLSQTRSVWDKRGH